MPRALFPEEELTLIDTEAPQASATWERPVAGDTDRFIAKPSTARGNVAVSKEVPLGSKEWTQRYGEYSTLQQHVLFWDRDGDGIITVPDIYNGFRDLGFNVVFSLCALLINLFFSYPTRLAHSYIPDPFFRIYVDSIHKAKHGSDSGVYDFEGRYVAQKFEDIFAACDKSGSGSLTLGELFDALKRHRCVGDPFGWGSAVLEWGTTWVLIQKDGRVYKEDLRQMYDGSLFWRIREETRRGNWQQGYGLGRRGLLGTAYSYMGK